jgi:ABC-2 type transport system ATP-binding protein
MNVIECRQLSKSYLRKRALHQLTFSIRENTITGVIGRNGAGKTTLLKIIAGFYRPSSGEITVFSERPFNSMKVSQNMIYIDDQITLPTSLSLLDILHMAGRFYPNWDHDLAARMLDYFNLDPLQHLHHLSKGLRSTFLAIVGLAARCPLTIFDEPTTGMDAAIRKDFYRALLKEYLAHPRTILLSSHLLHELDDLLEDVLLIDRGELKLHLPVDELKEYAVAIIGDRELVEWVIASRTVYHRQQSGISRYAAIIRRDEDVLEEARQHGLEIAPVSPEDICVYLTNQTKGRIDDVFDRTES